MTGSARTRRDGSGPGAADGHSQIGIVGNLSVDDYEQGVIRVHERVHAERAGHLADHLTGLRIQSSPIALAHRAARAAHQESARDRRGTAGGARRPAALPARQRRQHRRRRRDGRTHRIHLIDDRGINSACERRYPFLRRDIDAG